VKGLLVDFGGVLTTNVFDSFKQFSRAEGLREDAVKQIFRERGEGLALLRRLERGELTAEEFSQGFAPLLGVEPDGLVERLFAGVQPDEAMIAAVRRARTAGIKTGLISNSWGDGLAYDPALLEELFDAVVISGEVGIRKPTPEIYRLAAERIGVAPRLCVFVDDLPFNLAPAAELGMATVHHVNAEQTVAELERLLGIAGLLAG